MPVCNTAPGRLAAILSAWLVLGSGALAEAQAPAPDPSSESSAGRSREAVMVIGPGREADASALLAPVSDATPDTDWRGPQIDVDRIHWWLMAGDEVRASLTLVPRSLGSDDAPRSTSFAIEIAWAPDSSPSAAERALMAEASAAIQANDSGDFYGVALDNALAGTAEPEAQQPEVADPDALRRRWALRITGVAALGLLALGVVVRGLLVRPIDSSSSA